MIRLLSPIDLPWLTTIRRMLPYDEACTRDVLGASTPTTTTMGVFLGPWVNLRSTQKQQSWVYTDKDGLHGFVSARSHNESFCWEIDHLLLRKNNFNGICCDLLTTVSHDSRKWAARRIFLRLTADNPLTNTIRQVGFTPYLRESLYQLNSTWTDNKSKTSPRFSVRPPTKNDEYSLFQLYNAVFPAPVRIVEGVTFGEWREVRGSLTCQRWKSQLICEYKGSIVAHIRTSRRRHIGQFEVMITPGEDAEEIFGQIIAGLGNASIVRCLVPAHDSKLVESLKRHGFNLIGEYDVLANLSALRVQEPALAPVHI